MCVDAYMHNVLVPVGVRARARIIFTATIYRCDVALGRRRDAVRLSLASSLETHTTIAPPPPPTFEFILLETVEGEGLEVVLGGIILDDGEFGVDEGEEEDVAEGPGQLHRFHRDDVAEEGKGGRHLQLTLPFPMLLCLPWKEGREGKAGREERMGMKGKEKRGNEGKEKREGREERWEGRKERWEEKEGSEEGRKGRMRGG